VRPSFSALWDFAEDLQNETAFSAIFANSAHGCAIYKGAGLLFSGR
jgi:hypothetical protein